MDTVDHPPVTTLLERSRSARAESRRIGERRAEILEHVGQEKRRSLSETTARIDRETTGHPTMIARLDRLSSRIGRSAEIEHAKALLASRYGITRGEAFAILRSISSHSNRKLRDVATELVAGASDDERATLNHAG
jgi:hypothetical protein